MERYAGDTCMAGALHGAHQFFWCHNSHRPRPLSRVGIRLPGFTIGPKRLTAPALHFHDLPQIDANPSVARAL